MPTAHALATTAAGPSRALANCATGTRIARLDRAPSPHAPAPSSTRSARSRGLRCRRALRSDVVAAHALGGAGDALVFELSLFGFRNPLEDAARDADGNLPPWFPVVSFVAYVWIAGEVRKVRQEQERKAMEKASKAASAAAQRKLEGVTPEAWAKLVLCVVIDVIGDSSFLLPGAGELADVAYAPLEAFLLAQLFRSSAISGLGFIEEALPFTDVLPTATLAWILEEFFADSVVGKAVGLRQPEPEPHEGGKKDGKG